MKGADSGRKRVQKRAGDNPAFVYLHSINCPDSTRFPVICQAELPTRRGPPGSLDLGSGSAGSRGSWSVTWSSYATSRPVCCLFVP